ncbi:MAG: ABC transporter permease [Candidatus Dormibacteraeota bacterium]|nr:ABC transporter permease [Candidatus Dormibacteraeota bacterium]
MAVAQGAPRRGALLSIKMPRGRGFNLGVYIGKRILWLVPVLFFVITITFILMHFAPGSPWDREGRQLSPAIVANLDAKYGLNQPLLVQYGHYVWNVIHLDFGLSYQYEDQPVSNLLLKSWPPTAVIGTLSFILIVFLGIGIGIVAALRQNTWVDFLAVGFSTIGASVPNFVIGILLVIIFSVYAYRISGGNVFLPTGGFALDQHLIMPVITLAVLPIAFISRLTRASTLEVLRQDYIRTAWAKGLRERLVVTKHVLKNSLIPVVSALGPTFAVLITGSVIVETVFAIPGIGRAFVVAVGSRDYPMILASTILFSVIVALANLVVDLLYTVIDPRVRLG